jgi:hypothetical protein
LEARVHFVAHFTTNGDGSSIKLTSIHHQSSMADLPRTRQAWRIKRQGQPRKALQLEEVPLPKLQRDEVLIKVQAAALNPV